MWETVGICLLLRFSRCPPSLAARLLPCRRKPRSACIRAAPVLIATTIQRGECSSRTWTSASARPAARSVCRVCAKLDCTFRSSPSGFPRSSTEPRRCGGRSDWRGAMQRVFDQCPDQIELATSALAIGRIVRQKKLAAAGDSGSGGQLDFKQGRPGDGARAA